MKREYRLYIKERLPTLKEQIERILKEEEREEL